jgi:transcription elongation GreA/GreB family factor
VITLSSPLGRALIGARAGDTIEYAAPAGTLKATVLELQPAA